jgi:alpha-glucosidase
VFVRETAEQIVLVVAARDDFDVTLPPHAIAGLPVTLFGEMVAVQTSGGLRLSGSGPALGAFALPGITLPDFFAPGVILALE